MLFGQYFVAFHLFMKSRWIEAESLSCLLLTSIHVLESLYDDAFFDIGDELFERDALQAGWFRYRQGRGRAEVFRQRRAIKLSCGCDGDGAFNDHR